MAKRKIGTVIEPIETGRTFTTNMFTEALGYRYARGFHEVYTAGLEEREEKMRKLYETAMADEFLSEKQKQIMKGCYIGFNQAICRNSMSTPLIAFVAAKKPVLSKSIQTSRKKGNRTVRSKRLQRTIESLADTVRATGFYFEVSYLPILIKVLESQFLNNEEEVYDRNTALEDLIMAALNEQVGYLVKTIRTIQTLEARRILETKLLSPQSGLDPTSG